MTKDQVLPKPTPLSNLLIGPELAAHTQQLASSLNAKISTLNNTLHETEQAYRDARKFDLLELDKLDAQLPERYKRLGPQERRALADKEGIVLYSDKPTQDKGYAERERAKDSYGGWSKEVVALDVERRRIKAEIDGYNKLAAAFTTALRAPKIIDPSTLDLQNQKVLGVYEGQAFYPRGHPELTSTDIRLLTEYLKVKPAIEFELEK
jgi:hypothetical protein